MAQDPEQITAQLAKVTTRLEALAKRQRGGGPLILQLHFDVRTRYSGAGH